MAFLSTAFASSYPPTNNQLRTLTNSRNQATIQDGKVTVHNVQGRQTQSYASTGTKGNAIGIWVNRNMGNVTANQSKVVRCYNCKDTASSSSRGGGVILDEEQLAFLADIGERDDSGLDTQALTTTAIFHTDDLDAFDSDCDEAPSASAVLMAKLYAYDSNVPSKVPNHDTYQDNNVIVQSVQEMQYSEQPDFVDDSTIDITSENNAISYDQYLKVNESEVVQDTNSSEQQDAMIMSVIEKMFNQVAKCNAVNQDHKTIMNH
ncbi:hypothetical protein Tco_1274288 [Tanacetum coccineum]